MLSHLEVSNALGLFSLACWLVVLFPQLYENYRRKSSSSLSFLFILTWIIGDLFNLLGALLQGLLPSVVMIGMYYCLADVMLLSQMLWYARASSGGECVSEVRRPEEGEYTPLLAANAVATPTPTTQVLYGGLDMAVVAGRDTTTATASYHPQERQPSESSSSLPTTTATTATTTTNVKVFTLLFLLGVGGTLLMPPNTTQLLRVSDVGSGGDDSGWKFLVAQTFGWISAGLYVFARVPQILSNRRHRSCDGLSPWMFVFCVLGNATFTASILVYSLAPAHLRANLPWLVGSAGTISFDFVIFWQFWRYGARKATIPCTTDAAVVV